MKHLTRTAAMFVAATLATQAQAQSTSGYDPNLPAGYMETAPQSEFIIPPEVPDAVPALPAAVPANTPLPAAAPSAIPGAIVPAEQPAAPAIVAPARPNAGVTSPAPAPFAPAVAPAKVNPPIERARPIPLIQNKQPTEVAPDVTYVTGGIGDDELASIKASKAEYNTYVLSASTNGAFVGDAKVTIKDKSGKVMLDTVAGPILYVKLPAGSYTLDATLGQQSKRQAFTIGGKKGGTANIHLGWKVNATLSGE